MYGIVNQSHRFARFGCLLSALTALLIAPAAAQEEGAPADMGFGGMAGQERPAPDPSAGVVRVVKLKHAKAEDLRWLMKDVVPFDRLDCDERTNSLIAWGSSELMDQLDTVVAALDVLPSSPASLTPGVQIYSLRHLRADYELQEMLKKLVGGRDPRITTDPVRGLVIVAGETLDTYENVAKILSELDSPAPTAPPDKSSLKVRIVWILTGPAPLVADADLPEVPHDLLEVVDELGAIGITGLRLATQLVIGTDGRGEFEQSSMVMLMGDTCTLNVSGETSWVLEDRPTLDITIRGSDDSGIFLKTTLSAPVDHAVVLGVSPIGELTSVFVLQVIQ